MKLATFFLTAALSAGLFSAVVISDTAQADNAKHKAKSLPPGLQKKVARGEPLPPGWQKKLNKGQRLDDVYYDRAKVISSGDNPKGVITVEIEGRVVRLIQATHEIYDILR